MTGWNWKYKSLKQTYFNHPIGEYILLVAINQVVGSATKYKLRVKPNGKSLVINGVEKQKRQILMWCLFLK